MYLDVSVIISIRCFECPEGDEDRAPLCHARGNYSYANQCICQGSSDRFRNLTVARFEVISNNVCSEISVTAVYVVLLSKKTLSYPDLTSIYSMTSRIGYIEDIFEVPVWQRHF